MVMMLNQAPVNTAAVSYTAIWALRNVEVARPKNSCESLYLSIPPPPPLSSVGSHIFLSHHLGLLQGEV